MGIIDGVISLLVKNATITHKEKLSDHAYHLRIKSPEFSEVNYMPGYFLRVVCGMGKDVPMRDKVRSYSVWNLNREQGYIDLAVCTHSDGVGTAWALESKVGDKVHFGWHKGKFVVDATANQYLFIGDLSALAHLYEIHRNLPNGKTINSVIYAPSLADLFADIDGQAPFNFHELATNPSDQIIELLQPIIKGLKGNGMVYIGGDSRVCVALHQYFKKELGWQVSQIKAKPFWNPNKKGLE